MSCTTYVCQLDGELCVGILANFRITLITKVNITDALVDLTIYDSLDITSRFVYGLNTSIDREK